MRPTIVVDMRVHVAFVCWSSRLTAAQARDHGGAPAVVISLAALADSNAEKDFVAISADNFAGVSRERLSLGKNRAAVSSRLLTSNLDTAWLQRSPPAYIILASTFAQDVPAESPHADCRGAVTNNGLRQHTCVFCRGGRTAQRISIIILPGSSSNFLTLSAHLAHSAPSTMR